MHLNPLPFSLLPNPLTLFLWFTQVSKNLLFIFSSADIYYHQAVPEVGQCSLVGLPQVSGPVCVLTPTPTPKGSVWWGDGVSGSAGSLSPIQQLLLGQSACPALCLLLQVTLLCSISLLNHHYQWCFSGMLNKMHVHFIKQFFQILFLCFL